MNLLIAAVILFILYVLSIKPYTKRKNKMQAYTQQYIAHRGLHDNKSCAPENSMKAFKLAVEKGYGIELDVRLTKDKKVVVAHDENIKRISGQAIDIESCTYEELSKYKIYDSDETIPLFSEVLRFVNGAVPLIVELKAERNFSTTSQLTADILDRYTGEYCVESFNPLVIGWFRMNRPRVLRGILATNYFKDNIKQLLIIKCVLSNLMMNFIAKPDFIAFNHKHKNSWSFRICKRLYKCSTAAWTVKSKKDEENCKDWFDILIAEKYI